MSGSLDEDDLQTFIDTATHPRQWTSRASELMHAAATLKPNIHHYFEMVDLQFRLMWEHDLPDATVTKPPSTASVFFMLVAFALENLFKAKLVKVRENHYREVIKETRKLPEELVTHNLVNLAEKVGLELSTQRERLLHRLQRGSLWWGRYPTTRGAEEYFKNPILSDGQEHFIAGYKEEDAEKMMPGCPRGFCSWITF